MMWSRTPVTLAALSVLVVAGLSVWGWALDPEHPVRWMRIALLLPVLWVLLEFAQYRGEDRRTGEAIMTWHRRVIAGAGLVLALPLALRLAVAGDLLDPSLGPIAPRLAGVLSGVGIAVWGNYLPKLLCPWKVQDEPFDWQRVHRFVGWLAVLVGVSLVVASVTLPPAEAKLASGSLWVTLALFSVGRKLMSVAAYSRVAP